MAELTALRELRQQHRTNVLAAAVSDTQQPIPPHPLGRGKLEYFFKRYCRV